MFYQPPIMNPDSSKTKTIFMFSPINCQKTHKTSSGTWFSLLLCVTDMTVIWFCDWKSYIYCMILMLKRSYRRNSMIRSPCSIRTPAHSFKNMKHNTVKMTRHSGPQWEGDSWMLIPHFSGGVTCFWVRSNYLATVQIQNETATTLSFRCGQITIVTSYLLVAVAQKVDLLILH